MCPDSMSAPATSTTETLTSLSPIITQSTLVSWLQLISLHLHSAMGLLLNLKCIPDTLLVQNSKKCKINLNIEFFKRNLQLLLILNLVQNPSTGCQESFARSRVCWWCRAGQTLRVMVRGHWVDLAITCKKFCYSSLVEHLSEGFIKNLRKD